MLGYDFAIWFLRICVIFRDKSSTTIAIYCQWKPTKQKHNCNLLLMKTNWTTTVLVIIAVSLKIVESFYGHMINFSPQNMYSYTFNLLLWILLQSSDWNWPCPTEFWRRDLQFLLQKMKLFMVNKGKNITKSDNRLGFFFFIARCTLSMTKIVMTPTEQPKL